MEEWESRIIHTDKGVVRLRPVADRARELFGAAGADSMADAIESNAASSGQLSLFPDEAPISQGTDKERQARQQRPQLRTPKADGTRRPWTGSTPPCCSKRQVGRRRSETSSAPNRTGDRTSSGSPTPCLPYTHEGSEEKRLLDGMLLAAPR